MKNALLTLIYRFQKFGSGICFERLTRAFDLLEIHHYLAKTVTTVITGTNGKGSTAHKLANLLTAHGADTGLFTSPHFIEYNERFIHQGKKISYSTLYLHAQQLMPTVKDIETELNQHFGRFEILLLLALKVFASRNIEYLVIEAGIGGRFDPVRLLQAPLCALTSIDLEHTQLLGNTHEQIAYDKLDATPVGGHCIVGQLTTNSEQHQQLIHKLVCYAQLSNISVHQAQHQITINSLNSKQLTIHFQSNQAATIHLQTKQLTHIDKINWQMALALFAQICQHNPQTNLHPPHQNINISETNIQIAFDRQYHAGRFDIIQHDPTIILDSAHTPSAYQWLFNTIIDHYQDKPQILVVGLSQGRNVAGFKQQLKRLQSTIIVTETVNGIAAQDLAAQLSADIAFSDIGQALEYAKTKAIIDGSRIFVVGGLFLAASASAYLQGKDHLHLDHD